MSLIKYNPSLAPLFDNFDDLLSIFDSLDPMSRPVQSVTGPRTTVQNLEDKHLIRLATPGVTKEELMINLETQTMVSSGLSRSRGPCQRMWMLKL